MYSMNHQKEPKEKLAQHKSPKGRANFRIGHGIGKDAFIKLGDQTAKIKKNSISVFHITVSLRS